MNKCSRAFASAISLSAFTALTVAPRAAHAQREIGYIEHVPRESPQHWELELRFSPYSPRIDDEPGLKGTPYKDTFGTMKRLLFSLELDYQALRIPYVGALGPGLSVGYTQMTDSSFRTNGTRSTEDTDLSLYPFYGVAVLRLDEAWRRAGVPLVPYGKLGLGYTIWKISNPGGTATVTDAAGNVTKGFGGTWGVHGAVGLQFAMDVLDRGAVRNLDTAVGINHTYLFAEYYWSELSGIGQSHPLRVGDRTWALGLSFEF